MTKSDRKRAAEALARHEQRFREAFSAGPATAVLAAAVDWLRADCAAAARFLDDDGDGWAEQYITEAAILVHQVAARAAGEIRAELK